MEQAGLTQKLANLQIADSSSSNGTNDPAAQPDDSKDSKDSRPSDSSYSTSAANPEDVITLNVGGRVFSCQRRTLCLVDESLLALMFSGRWPGGGPRDAAGNVFLDLDPDLFDIVLNWLRQFTMTRGGNILEPEVPPSRLSHMVAMLDYLQLHRHIPLSYPESFDMQHYSPFMAVHGSTATRTALAGSHPGKHTGGARNSLMQFAVSDHAYFDMVVELSLEVLSFNDSLESSKTPQYMFIGFMHQAAAAVLDPAGEINTQLTKSPSCYGWLVGGGCAYTVRNGHRSKEPCSRNGLLWHQGEQLVLTLDCRREQQCASISLLNTVTGLNKSLQAQPTFGSSGRGSSSSSTSSSAAAAAAAGTVGRGNRKSRPGLRHRVPKVATWGGLPLMWPGLGPEREEILDILRQQPDDVNVQVAELVVGAAMQVLEAQGLGMQAAIDILGRPGLVQRLVQQVQNVVQPAQAAVQAAGAANAQQARGAAAAAPPPPPPPPPAAAAAGDAAAAGAANQQTADQQQQQQSSPRVAAADEQGDSQGHPSGAVRLNGQLLPTSTAEYDWVLVVGVVHPKDSIRILSATRKGQRPGTVTV